jgi:hypothetical protein
MSGAAVFREAIEGFDVNKKSSSSSSSSSSKGVGVTRFISLANVSDSKEKHKKWIFIDTPFNYDYIRLTEQTSGI